MFLPTDHIVSRCGTGRSPVRKKLFPGAGLRDDCSMSNSWTTVSNF